MKYGQLGRAGVQVSRICLGTMNFGPVTDEVASRGILDLAVESGVTFIDTADVYGGAPWGSRNGQTEEILGRWFADRGPRLRDDMFLATKVFGDMGDGPNERGLSALHIRRAVDDSLRRLQTDRIDLYQMHHIDRSTPIDEILEAFSRLRNEGKILYLGSSNFAGWNLAQYEEFARATGSPRLTSEQSIYNLANRSLELEVIPAALHYGIGLLAYSPLAGGLLGGMMRKPHLTRSAGALEWTGASIDQVEQYETLADEFATLPAQLGVAWLLHQPAVAAAVIGPRTADHLLSAIAAVDIALTDEKLGALDSVWPGPGGQAPEVYAW